MREQGKMMWARGMPPNSLGKCRNGDLSPLSFHRQSYSSLEFIMLNLQNSVLSIIIALALAIVASAQSPDASKSVKFAKRKLFVSPYESCDVGDINRDGHLDIVYGPYWFAGPDFLPHTYRANHTSAEYIRANSDHLYDVDKDGWLDVIMGGWGEEGIIWYKNPGQRRGRARRAVGNAFAMGVARAWRRLAANMEMFALHDYDLDGVPELHSACYARQDAAGSVAVREGLRRQPVSEAVRARPRRRRARLRVRRRERRRPRRRALRNWLVRAAGGRPVRPLVEATSGTEPGQASTPAARSW